MRLYRHIFPLLALAACAAAAPPASMRLDFYHTGNSTQEVFSLDRIVVEPLPWAGNPARPIDNTNRGTYFFEVKDAASQRVLYSRGFSSIFGEWVTTEEAKRLTRSFSESLRFPEPGAPVEIVVKKRDENNRFRDVWTAKVDPKDKFVDRSKPPAPAKLIEVEKNGDPAMKADLLLLGEGYTAAEAAKCEADIRRLAAGVLTYSPFKERRQDINVWGLCPPAAESGVSHPSRGIYRRTLFGSTFDAFGTERYALSFDTRAMREIAAHAPYDVLGIVMNYKEYGNGGIFGMYAGVSVDHPNAVSVFVHEFGHHFADLGDEYYYNANVAYAPATRKVEPYEPNITALLDPQNLKWKSLVEPGTPIPTPWDKDGYENAVPNAQAKAKQMRAEKRPEEEIRAMLNEARARQKRALVEGPHAGKIGAFEGAKYEVKGYYRPALRCIMISGNEFCKVCQRGIEDIIDLYSRN